MMAAKCPKCDFDNTSDSKFCKECGTQLPSIHDIAFTETLEAPIKQLSTGSIFAGRYQVTEERGRLFSEWQREDLLFDGVVTFDGNII